MVDIQTILIFLTVLFVGEVALLVVFIRLRARMERAFGNADTGDVMDMLAKVLERSENIEESIRTVFEENKQSREVLQKTLHKVSLVRFNPFEGMGGTQSFCVALLDADHSGILITSLYAKDGIRTYAKKIIKGESEHPLSEEEEGALNEAMK